MALNENGSNTDILGGRNDSYYAEMVECCDRCLYSGLVSKPQV